MSGQKSAVVVLLWLALLAASPAQGVVFVHTSDADFSGGANDSTAISAPGDVTVETEGLAVYAEDLQPRPHARVWTGGLFGPEFDGVRISDDELWQIGGAWCPRREEAILVTGDLLGTWGAQVWDGASFGNDIVLGASPNEPLRAHAAAAYESLSGDGLVVYDGGAGSPLYRTWGGSGWGPELPVGLGNTGEPTQIVLAADPGSDRIVLILVDNGLDVVGDAWVVIWDGTGWIDALPLQEDGNARDESPAAAWMAASGQALVMWTDGSDTSPRYRIWSDGWGAEEAAPPTGSLRPRLLRLEAEPRSDRLLMTAITEGDGSGNNYRQIYATFWDGVSWDPSSFRLEDQSPSRLDSRVHAVFERDSGQALAVFTDEDTRPLYSVFDGTSWSGEAPAIDISGALVRVDLAADPHSDTVLFTYVEETSVTGRQLWDGSDFVSSETLEPSASTDRGRPVLFLYEADPPVYTSPVIDVGAADTDWGLVEWSWSGPAGTAIRLQVAASNVPEPDLFVGPDGTPNSFHAASAGSPLALGTRGRYLRYRATFQCSDAGEPVLEEVAVTTGAPPEAPVFVSTNHVTPEGPLDLAVGDLDGDGRSDVVTVHSELEAVSVQLAAGPGTFQAPRVFPAGAATRAIRLGDMNGDGYLDAVVAGTGDLPGAGPTAPVGRAWADSGLVCVLLGDGAGGFGEPSSFAAGSGPYGLALLDLGLDGQLDVAVTDITGNGIIILTDDGWGELRQTGFIATGSGPAGIESADLNGDGRPDLVATLPDAPGIVILTSDDWEFDAPSFIATGSGPIGVALGDLDADGRIDAALADPASDSTVVLLGDGDGGFGEPASFSTGSGPTGIVVADFNSDCSLDVATANAGSNDVSVLLGNGFGGLHPPYAFAVGGAPSAIGIIDVQPDSKTDLVVSLPSESALVVLENNTTQRLELDLRQDDDDCEATSVRFGADKGFDDAAVEHFVWDFGDGTDPLPIVSLPAEVDHEYDLPGLYTVSLTAESVSGGCLARVERELEILPVIVAEPAGPYWVCLDAVETSVHCFTLDGSRSRAFRPDREITSWEWELDPSGMSIGEDAVSEYCVAIPPVPLSTDVRLTVTDSEDCSDSQLTEVSLRALAEPDLTASADGLCAGQTVSLATEGGYDTYLWSTGEDSPTIEVTPVADTTYGVTVSGPWGCRSDAELTVRVNPDSPILTEVPRIRLVKQSDGSLRLDYDTIAAAGYNLHRAETPAGLPDAAPLQYVEGSASFEDPSAGTFYYQVRGASDCSHTSGP